MTEMEVRREVLETTYHVVLHVLGVESVGNVLR